MWNTNLKRGILICGFAAFSLYSFAQVGDYRNELAFGFTGGMNMASVSFNPSLKQGTLRGENIGVTLRYTCEKYITAICALQVECNYATQGWKETVDDSPATFSKTMKYVQVPLLARLGWGRERKGLQGYIVLGPQMGFLLSEKSNSDDEWWNIEHSHTHQYTHDADRKFDYGIAAGAGCELSLNRLGHFFVEARYYYGLRDFYDNSSRGYFGRSGHKAITVKVGYLFDLFRSKNPNIK